MLTVAYAYLEYSTYQFVGKLQGGWYQPPPPLPVLNLSYDGGGGALCAPPLFVFIFLLKISPPDQTLRPTYKFLILGIFYHDFFLSENLVYKKFYYINS